MTNGVKTRTEGQKILKLKPEADTMLAEVTEDQVYCMLADEGLIGLLRDGDSVYKDGHGYYVLVVRDSEQFSDAKRFIDWIMSKIRSLFIVREFEGTLPSGMVFA